ncbi:hypothetical protein [Promicromonospora soli]
MTAEEILDSWDDGAFYETTKPSERPRTWQVVIGWCASTDSQGTDR